MQIRRTAAALTSAAALSVTGVAVSTPAQAAPVITGGLVNITIVDTLNDLDILNDVLVNVQVPVGVAANVCGVNAAVLLAAAQQGPVDCDATVQDLPAIFQP